MSLGGSARQCPICKRQAPMEGSQKLGPWYVHAACRVMCSICGEEVTQPPVGQSRTVAPYLGAPVHTACKEEVQ